MSQYIDLVLCKHPTYERLFLFRAPAWAILNKGDKVIVDTRNGEKEAVVVNKITVDPTSDTYQFMLDATGARDPLKTVLRKITYQDFVYEEDVADE